MYMCQESKILSRKFFKITFQIFEEQYDDHYAKQYGKYRIIRIKEAVEKFIERGLQNMVPLPKLSPEKNPPLL